ncbi:MAG TPA: hypothetical protein VKA78_07230 [Pyrinomonadaceae bacterium]|nr:hypothetical protein [Pyrinomonadaceae bacterium]
MNPLIQDLRHGLRNLLKRPGFTAIVLVVSFLPAIRFSRQVNFAMQATGRGQVSTGIE